MIPAIARRIVYPLQERMLRRPTFSYLAELERSQWLPRDELKTIQLFKLNRLLKIAARNSPWHARRFAEAGLTDSIKNGSIDLASLRLIPTMTKSDARQNRDEIFWRAVPGGAYQYTTGGSTGEPLVFYFGRDRQASDAANRLRARSWWGVKPGDPEVYLWGAPIELNRTDRIKHIRDRLLNQLVLNAFAMTPHRMDAYLNAIEAWKPSSIYGYASSLALLAAHAQQRDRSLYLPSLRVVCTTGEPLYPHQRRLISRIFGAPVANEFGSRDSGLIAHEAPGGALLQMTESQLLEVLDENGDPCPPGVPGEAVITGFDSTAQPFIRYRTGDIVTVSNRSDPGGRGLTVLKSVTGRQTDFLVAANGTIMHALAAIYILRGIDGISSFKCIQHSIHDTQILIVPNDRWDEGSIAAIKHGFRARLGLSVDVRIDLVSEIPPEASGKHRYVVSHASQSTRDAGTDRSD